MTPHPTWASLTSARGGCVVPGGSGDYFDVADYVIMMDQYQPSDKTAEAKVGH